VERFTPKVTVGQLAVSKRGRDRGEPYLVLEIIDDAFVYLVDGDRRRIENPKRKNVKHLQFYPLVAEHLARQWEAGRVPIRRMGGVGNVEVRKAITGLMQTVSEVGRQGSEVEEEKS
jgi:hypothetical protein